MVHKKENINHIPGWERSMVFELEEQQNSFSNGTLDCLISKCLLVAK